MSDADQRVAESVAADADLGPDAYELPIDAPEALVVSGAAAVLGYLKS